MVGYQVIIVVREYNQVVYNIEKKSMFIDRVQIFFQLYRIRIFISDFCLTRIEILYCHHVVVYI